MNSKPAQFARRRKRAIDYVNVRSFKVLVSRSVVSVGALALTFSALSYFPGIVLRIPLKRNSL